MMLLIAMSPIIPMMMRLTEGECSVSCSAGYSSSRSYGPKATCNTNGTRFVLTGCYSDNDNSTPAPNFSINDNVGRWESYHGVEIDGDGNVLAWTSHPDKNGNTHRLETTGTGPHLLKMKA